MSDLPSRDNMLVQTSLERTPAWAVLVAYQRGELKSRDEMNEEAAINAFWAHASDLLRPTVSNTGIDAAVRLAVHAAWRDDAESS